MTASTARDIFQPRLLLSPVVLGILVCNIVLLVLLYGVARPWLNYNSTRVGVLETQVNTLAEKNTVNAGLIKRMPQDVPLYHDLANRRFVGTQDRLGMAALIQAERVPHKLSRTEFTVQPEMILEAATPSESRFRLVQSRLEIKTTGFIDSDVISFYNDLARTAPGQMVLQKITLQRAPESLQAPLDELSINQVMATMQADAVYAWYNLRPRAEEGAL